MYDTITSSWHGSLGSTASWAFGNSWTFMRPKGYDSPSENLQSVINLYNDNIQVSDKVYGSWSRMLNVDFLQSFQGFAEF